MPKPSNDAIVQRQRELRKTLILKHARIATEKISEHLDAKKKPTVEQIAELIAAEFLASGV